MLWVYPIRYIIPRDGIPNVKEKKQKPKKAAKKLVIRVAVVPLEKVPIPPKIPSTH